MEIYCPWVLMPQFATVSTSKKPGLRSSQSKKVRMGMSLLRFFAGRVVEIPRMECFGISGLRILPTVAFLYRCTSLYIGRGQVLFQNLLLIIAPSIRGRSERRFFFQLFIIAELLSKVIDIIPNERHEPF